MMFHTSPEIIKEISEDGRFGHFLFFSSDVYVMTGAPHYFTYEIDEDNLRIARNFVLAFETPDDLLCPYLDEISERTGLSEDAARDLFLEDTNIYGLKREARQLSDNGRILDLGWFETAELAWDIQLYRAEVAEKLGFDGVETSDETGTSYIVNAHKAMAIWTLKSLNPKKH